MNAHLKVDFISSTLNLVLITYILVVPLKKFICHMLILDFSDFVNLITDTELGVHYLYFRDANKLS